VGQFYEVLLARLVVSITKTFFYIKRTYSLFECS